MAVLTTLLLVWHGITGAFGKVWDVSKQVISWFIQVMPRPLRFIFFLYLILFFSSMVIPKFVGLGMSCDSQGDAYSFNFLDAIQEQGYIDTLGSICGIENVDNTANRSILLTPIYVFIDMYNDVFRNTVSKPATIKQFYDLYQNGEFDNDTITEYCADYRYFINSNPDEIASKDFVLHHFATSNTNTDYKALIHVKCSLDKRGDYYPTLYLYQIDVFNFDLWISLAVATILCWFGVWWYKVALKK